ncbi:glycosyltransferase family 4 protein [Planctomycetota bacterium]
MNQKCTKPKVLIVGPGRTARTGITAVLLAYERSDIWIKYHCEWLETYDDVSNWRKIRAALRALLFAPNLMLKTDIVHIHAAHNTSFYRKTIFFLLAKLLRKKVIVHLHAPSPKPFARRSLSLVSRYVLNWADSVVALSDIWAKEIRKIAPNAKITVIPNPCCVPSLAIESRDKTKPIILFAGKLEDRKGFCDLIRAMPIVLSKVPNAKLLFAGHGDIERGKRLAQLMGIGSSVQFLGWLKNSQKAEVFRQASVFCLPSYGEGVPMAMLEAIAYQVPVVVTPVGGIPDVVSDRYNGLFVKPGKDVEIAQAIIDILTNHKLRIALAENAYQTVRQKFSPDIVSKQVGSLYEKLSKKR